MYLCFLELTKNHQNSLIDKGTDPSVRYNTIDVHQLYTSD